MFLSLIWFQSEPNPINFVEVKQEVVDDDEYEDNKYENNPNDQVGMDRISGIRLGIMCSERIYMYTLRALPSGIIFCWGKGNKQKCGDVI